MSLPFYFDIETIPDQASGAFDRHLEAVHPPRNYKNKDTIANWMEENAERIAHEEHAKTALDGLRGEICSIAWAIGEDTIHAVDREECPDEAELLETFFDRVYNQARHLTKGEPDFFKLEWIGFNLIEFDLRFLQQRCWVKNIRPAFAIPVDARHGNDWVFDCMKQWTGWRGYVKQSELVEAFGIEPPEWMEDDIRDIDGSHVWDLYRHREYGIIREYNRLDVHYVRELYRRMTR